MEERAGTIRYVDVSALAVTRENTVSAFWILSFFGSLATADGHKATSGVAGIASYALDPFWNGVAWLVFGVGIALRLRVLGFGFILYLAGIIAFYPEFWFTLGWLSIVPLFIAILPVVGAVSAIRWPSLKRRFVGATPTRPRTVARVRASLRRVAIRQWDAALFLALISVNLGVRMLLDSSSQVERIQDAMQGVPWVSTHLALVGQILVALLQMVVMSLGRKRATIAAGEWFIVFFAVGECFSYALKLQGAPRILLITVLLALAYQALDRARRHVARGAKSLLAEVPDKYFLYLRSFIDDQLSVEGPWYSLRTWLQSRGLHTYRFELALDHQLRPFGPLVAIAQPGEELALLGAARELAADTEWQDLVSNRMRGAQQIFLVPNDHAGLLWEIHQIESLGLLDKLVLVIPPDRSADGSDAAKPPALERWRTFVEATKGVGWLSRLSEVNLEKALFVLIDASGDMLVLHGDRVLAHYYGEALACVVGARSLPPAVESRESSRFRRWLTVSAAGIAGLVYVALAYRAGRDARAAHRDFEAKKAAARALETQQMASGAVFDELSAHGNMLLARVIGTVAPGACRWILGTDEPKPTYSVECRATLGERTMTTTASVSPDSASAKAPFTCSWSGASYTVKLDILRRDATYNIISQAGGSPQSAVARAMLRQSNDRWLAENTPKVEVRFLGRVADETATGPWHEVTSLQP